MNEFSKELLDAIEKGEVVIYEETKQARVSVDIDEKRVESILIGGKRNKGLIAELEHLGYEILR